MRFVGRGFGRGEGGRGGGGRVTADMSLCRFPMQDTTCAGVLIRISGF